MKPMRAPRPAAQRGFMLVEALVAVLIMAFGLLGLVGLQTSMTRAQTSAHFRADAAYFASQLTGAMWADTLNLASYGTSECDSNERCKAWLERVGTVLPGGSADVVVNGANVTITIGWSAPGEGKHSLTTVTAIAR